MKSFIAYPLEFETLLYPCISEKNSTDRLFPHLELFDKLKALDGSVVKCGITPEEGFTRFLMFKEMMGEPFARKMVAFEKFAPALVEDIEFISNQVVKRNKHHLPKNFTEKQKKLLQKAKFENVEFVPGNVCQTIPEYLIENPEVKLSLLNIDMNDYEATITALEFFFPRIVPGGLLLLDNYAENKAERSAVDEYFAPGKVIINSFSAKSGPHYIAKD